MEFNPEAPTSYIEWLTKRWEMDERQKSHQEVREAMEVHIDGKYAYKLIDTRRPREDDAIKLFRQKNYVAITKGIVRQAIDGLFRIFDEQGYEINTSQDTTEYINERNFHGYTLMGWVQDKLVVSMLRDPNAYLLAIPYGPGIKQANQKVDVEPRIIDSTMLREWTATHITWLTQDKSILIDGRGQMVQSGKVYMVLTTEAVYNIKQIGRESDNTYTLELVYEHNFGFLPACVLGGTWRQEIMGYESFFASAIPYGDEAIRQFSDFQGTLITQAYPVKEVKPIQCKAEGCEDGRVYEDGKPHHNCKVCKGTGVIIDSSPYSYIIGREHNPKVDGEYKDIPTIKYYPPPVDSLEFQWKTLEKMLLMFKGALHLSYIEEAQSGTAKRIDRENQYAMILKISNRIFDLVYDLVWWIESYRNTTNAKKPSVVKPEDFSLRTDEDLLNDLNEMKKAGAPINTVTEVVKEILKRRWAGNSQVYKEQMFLLEYDPLYVYTQQEKLAMKAAGAINTEQLVRSINAANILQRLKREKTITFTQSEYSKIYAALDAEVDKMLAELNESKMPLRNDKGETEAEAKDDTETE